MKTSFLIALTCIGPLVSAAFARDPLPPIEIDKKLGADAEAEILADPGKYPILPRRGYEAAYTYLDEIKANILATGKVVHADDFDWKFHIINDPDTVNAFVMPGGYIYVYTGLIHYLDNEAELAGVIAHEIAHADRRHSITQLRKDTIVSRMKQRRGVQAPPVLGQLRSLSYDRNQEAEADEYSVIYLCASKYHAPSATGFFEKMNEEGGRQRPEFLSTHPHDEKRTDAMNAKIREVGYSGNLTNEPAHAAIKATLPAKSSRSAAAPTTSEPSERPIRRLPRRP